jgi:hypothetical protein
MLHLPESKKVAGYAIVTALRPRRNMSNVSRCRFGGPAQLSLLYGISMNENHAKLKSEVFIGAISAR